VVIDTDAPIEASDAAGRMPGEAGLLELARALETRDPIGLGPALLDAVDRHLARKPDVYAKVFGLKPV
jgi:hypothetical protein